MKNKILKRRISLIILNFVILIGLMSSFTIATFAWFTNNRRAQIIARQIEIGAPGFQIHSYKVYPVMVVNEGSTTNSYTFENSPAVRMPRFDPQDIEYTQYRRALVVHITFTYTEMNNVYLYAKTNTGAFYTGLSGSGEYDENVTSNVFQLTHASNVTLPNGWSTATLSYNKANTTSFVTLNPNLVKQTQIPLTTLSNGDSELWFVIEYNVPVMNYINDIRADAIKEVMYHDDITYYVGA